MRKQQNDNSDGGFFECVDNARNRPESTNALLEHPVFIDELRRISRSIAPTWTDADDLFSDVCIKLPLVIHQFDPSKPNGSFSKWLRRVTQNLFIDGLRRPSLVLDHTPSDEHYELASSSADPYEQLWQRELEKELNKLIDSLNEPERSILKYYFENLSFREIQDTLKDAHGIRRTHVTARNVVKRLLQELWDTKVAVPQINRKANKVSRPPITKAKINRKPEKISKRRSSTRRIALKK